VSPKKKDKRGRGVLKRGMGRGFGDSRISARSRETQILRGEKAILSIPARVRIGSIKVRLKRIAGARELGQAREIGERLLYRRFVENATKKAQ